MKRILKRVVLTLLLLIIIGTLTLHFHSVYKRNQILDAVDDQSINEYETLEVNNKTMAYRIKGSSERPTLVLVHGFLGSSYDFRKMIEPLSEDYQVIAIDMIGFGHSDKPSKFVYNELNQASYIKELLETLEIDNYALLGHSMGARVALKLNHLDTEKVEQLILLSPAGITGDQSSSSPPTLFYDYLFKNYTLQRLGFRGVHHQNEYKTASYFDPMYYFTSQIPSNVLMKMNESESLTDWDEVIDQTVVETLIIVGMNDTWTPKTISENYESRLINATLKVIENTGHMPMIESVDDTLKWVNDFLD